MTTHVVAISGGKDSVAMALRLAELNPGMDYRYISTPVGNEPAEFFEHLRKVESLLGRDIEFLQPYSGDGLEAVIEDNGMIPNFRARFCTRILKIEPAIAYLKANAPAIQYVGLRADEEERGGIYGDIEGVEQAYPLKEWGWGIGEVWDYLAAKGVQIPDETNCMWCFWKRLIQWYLLWLNNRESYERACEVEDRMGYTFRSDGRDTWPASLRELAKEFESGRKPPGWGKYLHRKQQMQLFDCDMDSMCRVCTL